MILNHSTQWSTRQIHGFAETIQCLSMANSLYISTTEVGSGKALISLGVMELLSHKTSKIGFFRPIIHKPEKGKMMRISN